MGRLGTDTALRDFFREGSRTTRASAEILLDTWLQTFRALKAYAVDLSDVLYLAVDSRAQRADRSSGYSAENRRHEPGARFAREVSAALLGAGSNLAAAWIEALAGC
jgi:hypothetical protein